MKKTLMAKAKYLFICCENLLPEIIVQGVHWSKKFLITLTAEKQHNSKRLSLLMESHDVASIFRCYLMLPPCWYNVQWLAISKEFLNKMGCSVFEIYVCFYVLVRICLKVFSMSKATTCTVLPFSIGNELGCDNIYSMKLTCYMFVYM